MAKLDYWKQRYTEAYDEYQHREFPAASKDFGTLPPKYPDVRTSNGLTRFICDFIKFKGFRATRVNTQGRMVECTTREESGAVFMDKKWITSSTRKGTADVSSTILGRTVMFEVKVGDDQPRVNQLKEASRERKAGGVYEFVYSPDDFLIIFDGLIDCFTNNKPVVIPEHAGTIEEAKAVEKFIKKGELTMMDL